VGFAVVACGVIGPPHGRAIAGLDGRARLVAAVDPVFERAEKLTAEFGGEPLESLAAALDRPDVDAVSICTPSGYHVEMALAALAAGKHVIVEKPIDVSVEAADRLVAAAAASDRTVTVIAQHRFDPSSQAVHAATVAGQFGRLTSGVASLSWWRSQGYYDSGDWRGTWALDGGGALMNQGVHTLDLLVWLMGDPVSVTATAGLLAHEIEVEDTLVATVTFASGALAVVHATTAAYPGLSSRVQILGSRGSAVIDDDQLVFFHVGAPGEGPAYGTGLSDNQATQVLPEQSVREGTAGADPSSLSDAHTLQYGDFLDAVATGRDPLVTPAQARRSVATIAAIYASARNGGAVSSV
jgi:UDP-N-acetyl-2-amino-2-deoxyglucuronate dehydrogenase